MNSCLFPWIEQQSRCPIRHCWIMTSDCQAQYLYCDITKMCGIIRSLRVGYLNIVNFSQACPNGHREHTLDDRHALILDSPLLWSTTSIPSPESVEELCIVVLIELASLMVNLEKTYWHFAVVFETDCNILWLLDNWHDINQHPLWEPTCGDTS